MNRSEFTSIPGFVSGRIANRTAEINILLVVAGSFLLAVSAQFAIRLPFSPVPFSLQPLALLVIGATLGSARGAAAAMLYVLEGLAGFPVFAGGGAGPAVLIGPTAGYLYAFPAGAWIAGYVSERWGHSVPRVALGMAAAIAIVHLGGWSWLASIWNLGAAPAWTVGVAPFLVGDLVKIAFAATVLPVAQRLLNDLG